MLRYRYTFASLTGLGIILAIIIAFGSAFGSHFWMKSSARHAVENRGYTVTSMHRDWFAMQCWAFKDRFEWSFTTTGGGHGVVCNGIFQPTFIKLK